MAGETHTETYRHAVGEIDFETDELYGRLEDAASETWTWLVLGWMRQRRPNVHVDLMALKGALKLDERCSAALDNPAVFWHANTNYSRYELYAAAVLVRNILPIPIDERAALAHAVGEYVTQARRWEAEPSAHHAQLIDDWRAWLRQDGKKRTPGAELHGEASLLAAASGRITMTLNPGRHGYLFHEVDTLVKPTGADPWRHPPRP